MIAFLVALMIRLLSPNVKEQNNIYDEYDKNGYSDRYISLLSEAVNRAFKKPLNSIGIQYIMRLSEAYMMKDNIQESLNVINMISPQKYPDLLNPSNKLLNIVLYYDIQMCLCEKLNDVNRANNIMNEAFSSLYRYYGKYFVYDLIISEIFSVYNSLNGNDKEAMEDAEFVSKYNRRLAKYACNLQKARVYSLMGDKASANECLDIAKTFARKKAEIDKIDYCRRYYLQG